jgi:oxygen-independent coproporphyrinogen-3 oxidase
VGGGTPNSLNNEQMQKLLRVLKIKARKNCEFTIECNPSFVTNQQAQLFKTLGVNRISLGAQTLNEKILKKYNRVQTNAQLINSIKYLYANKIDNISLDFMYGFNEMKNSDIIDDINFIKKYKIKHVSFYSLECKENSTISKNGYVLDENKISEQFELIINKLKSIKFSRYEISS